MNNVLLGDSLPRYDPEQWAELAAAAGMKCFAITTKHHDGFCLWDTKLTNYKALDSVSAT